MLTLVTGAHSESQYCMLKHLEVMLREPAAKGVFDDEYRQVGGCFLWCVFYVCMLYFVCCVFEEGVKLF